MLANPDVITLFIIAIVCGFYILPLLFVLFSSRSQGGATFGWFIVTLLFSWLGFAIFLIVTQKPQRGAAAKTKRIDPNF